jgi:hypothetical protein
MASTKVMEDRNTHCVMYTAHNTRMHALRGSFDLMCDFFSFAHCVMGRRAPDAVQFTMALTS